VKAFLLRVCKNPMNLKIIEKAKLSCNTYQPVVSYLYVAM